MAVQMLVWGGRRVGHSVPSWWEGSEPGFEEYIENRVCRLCSILGRPCYIVTVQRRWVNISGEGRLSSCPTNLNNCSPQLLQQPEHALTDIRPLPACAAPICYDACDA